MNGRFKILASAVVTAIAAVGAVAGEIPASALPEAPERIGRTEVRARPHFVWDVGFEFRFDNREYGDGDFAPSMTVLGARLTPSVGLQLSSPGDSRHRLMVGIDVMKDFGSDARTEDLFRELTLYYEWKKGFGRTDMTLTAGIFPRSEMQGAYSTAFFSDYVRFYDPNLEGLILKFRRPSAYYELGCDWMGQYGDTTRERFMIFVGGEAALADRLLLLGYSGYMYHYAGSREVWGVVDNILLNPYIGLDLAEKTGLQTLHFQLGWLQSMQNDRRNIGRYTFPSGGEFLVRLGKWNVSVENRLFYGCDMMPYYDSADAAGHVYADGLYFGDPFYHLGRGGADMGLYDRLEICYGPRIADFLRLQVSAAMHFHGSGFSGWQQIVSLVFDLPDRKSSRRLRPQAD